MKRSALFKFFGRAIRQQELQKTEHAFLQSLVSNGTVGAWYSLEGGPVAEVLFSRTTDTKVLQDALAQHPAAKLAGTKVLVWGQWLSKGVLK